MSCAACSARVEKAVSGVEGVTSCSVSLLTNSMGVEGNADSGKIIAAVEAAGYGASLKTADKKEKQQNKADSLEDKETPVLKRRLVASLGFLAVLMYISMAHHSISILKTLRLKWIALQLFQHFPHLLALIASHRRLFAFNAHLPETLFYHIHVVRQHRF